MTEESKSDIEEIAFRLESLKEQLLRTDSKQKDDEVHEFWNEKCEKNTKILPLPSENDFISNTCLINQFHNCPMKESWYKTIETTIASNESEKIILPSMLYNLPCSMDKTTTGGENPKRKKILSFNNKKKAKNNLTESGEDKPLLTLTIRLFPNAKEKQYICEAEGMSRYTYNTALDIVRHVQIPSTDGTQKDTPLSSFLRKIEQLDKPTSTCTFLIDNHACGKECVNKRRFCKEHVLTCQFILPKGKNKNKPCGKMTLLHSCFCKAHLPQCDECKEKSVAGWSKCKKHVLKCPIVCTKGKNKNKECNKICLPDEKVCEKHLPRDLERLNHIELRNFVSRVDVPSLSAEKQKKLTTDDTDVEETDEWNMEMKQILSKVPLPPDILFSCIYPFAKRLSDHLPLKYEYQTEKRSKHGEAWTKAWDAPVGVPKRFMYGSIDMLSQDINSCKGNKNTELSIGYKTRKDPIQHIYADGWMLGTGEKKIMFPSALKNIKGQFKMGRKKIPLETIIDSIKEEKTPHENRSYSILHNRNEKRYYLLLPVSVNWFLKWKHRETGRCCDIQTSRTRLPVVSIDPGVRKAWVLYDGLHVIKIAPDGADKLRELFEHLDELENKRRKKQGNHKRRQKRIQQIRSLRTRMHSLVDELQWKTISFLTQTYDLILLPSYPTSKMVRSKYLNYKTKRLMLIYRSGEFKRRLIEKCKITNTEIRIVLEPYTSRTCGSCGFVNKKSSNETFHCSHCGFTIDRDANGARNILLRYLSGKIALSDPIGFQKPIKELTNG